MEPITNQGVNLFRGTVRPESKSLGTIAFDGTGTVYFTPTPGMSFTHFDLYEISEFVKSMVKSNDGSQP